ncbi:hypothetical protein GCM10027176_27840 [Actinoallomurus bryophytorum]|uniref:Sporulation and spore germination protein n=1 Tax=Actinoallomurus bryophytorum TaxID=1490222 RepID=A0A543CSD2_9ACTN|nr:hypothetical protein [Actinoallomurus bryophytorum]TQL99938.1 hypothetical protein FB559_5640 [Actinoallomurus bryophytorum]
MIRAAGLVLAVLLLGGCGVRPTGVVYAGDAPTATASASPQAEVFFLARKMLVPVPRTVRPGDVQTVFDALLAGPTADERKRGLSTVLIGVQRIAVHELDGVTLLVETEPPAAKLSSIAFEQIYCTAMALPNRFMKISFVNGGGVPYPEVACGQGGKAPVPLAGGGGMG